MTGKPRTLYEKIWDAHVVERRDDGTCLIFIDRHLVHEVTSPQAFESLRMNGRKVRHPELTLAVPDHNLPTTPRLDAAGHRVPIADVESRGQLEALERNAPAFGVRYFDATSRNQGIVHVVGPEQGFTLPGTTLVCGDSHTAAHGALGALAFGIGASEVAHVLATQTLWQRKPRTLRLTIDRPGRLSPCSGPTTCTIPWRSSSSPKNSMPALLQSSCNACAIARFSGSAIRSRLRLSVGTK